MAGKTFTWTETFTASVEDARLVQLFEQHVPGKLAEILAEYLVENGPSDSDLWPILAAIRTEEGVEVEDVNDVSYEETD